MITQVSLYYEGFDKLKVSISEKKARTRGGGGHCTFMARGARDLWCSNAVFTVLSTKSLSETLMQ